MRREAKRRAKTDRTRPRRRPRNYWLDFHMTRPVGHFDTELQDRYLIEDEDEDEYDYD